MARLTWTSGDKATPWREVDGDAPAYASTLERVLRLIGYVYDVATGENSPATVLDGTGGGLGCPPGVPVSMAYPEWAASYSYTASGLAALHLLPIYKPPGETRLVVEVDEALGVDVRAELRASTSGLALVDEQRLEGAAALPDGTGRATFADLPDAGTLYILRVYHAATSGQRMELGGLRVHYGRLATSAAADPSMGVLTGSTAIPVPTAASGGATVDAVLDIDAAWVGEEMPVASYPLTIAARNLAALDELILARPAFGANATHTLAASAANDPAKDPFLCGSRSHYANEPRYHLPLWAVSFGVAPYGGGVGAALGKMSTARYTPGCLLSSTGTSQVREVARVPTHFPDGTGTLRVASLWSTPDASIGGGGVTIRHSAAGNSDVGVTALTSNLLIATTTPTYDDDDLQDAVIAYHTVTLKGTGEDLRLLGACAWIEG